MPWFRLLHIYSSSLHSELASILLHRSTWYVNTGRYLLNHILTSVARSTSSDHRYCAVHLDILPADSWIYAPSSVQKVQASYFLVARSHLAWTHHHHSRYHQRWSWARSRKQVRVSITATAGFILTCYSSRKGEIAYGVVAGIVYLIYIISIFVGESKRRRDRKAAVRAEAEPKRTDSDSNNSNTPGLRTNYYA
jgi:hypothetical protein